MNDNFIAASAFLTGDKRINASNAGANVVQNLYTILEYFDSSDVENIKVSFKFGSSLHCIALTTLRTEHCLTISSFAHARSLTLTHSKYRSEQWD